MYFMPILQTGLPTIARDLVNLMLNISIFSLVYSSFLCFSSVFPLFFKNNNPHLCKIGGDKNVGTNEANFLSEIDLGSV